MHRLLIAEDIPAIAVDIKTIARDLSIDVPSNSGSRPGGTQKRFGFDPSPKSGRDPAGHGSIGARMLTAPPSRRLD
ncbi:hypothetical protein [Sphingomonas sp. DC2300-3]|uniref:hypothetical protein n=1 Tax=unclassified Sphingomonas TaxID=196159 RepID=UPI003CFAC9C6